MLSGTVRALDPELTARSNGELEHHLPTLQATSEELVRTELLERHDLQRRRVLADTRNLQGVEDRDAAVALLRVEEGIRNRHRYLVAQLRGADRVAVDQDVGHDRILTPARGAKGPCIDSKA